MKFGYLICGVWLLIHPGVQRKPMQYLISPVNHGPPSLKTPFSPLPKGAWSQPPPCPVSPLLGSARWMQFA